MRIACSESSERSVRALKCWRVTLHKCLISPNKRSSASMVSSWNSSNAAWSTWRTSWLKRLMVSSDWSIRSSSANNRIGFSSRMTHRCNCSSSWRVSLLNRVRKFYKLSQSATNSKDPSCRRNSSLCRGCSNNDYDYEIHRLKFHWILNKEW